MTSIQKSIVFGIIAGIVLFFLALMVFQPKADASYSVVDKWCENEVTPTIDPSPTPEVTPEVTPEPTASPSASVDVPKSDGQSDHRSDGLSSCPSCTAAPVVPAGPPATGRGGE